MAGQRGEVSRGGEAVQGGSEIKDSWRTGSSVVYGICYRLEEVMFSWNRDFGVLFFENVFWCSPKELYEISFWFIYFFVMDTSPRDLIDCVFFKITSALKGCLLCRARKKKTFSYVIGDLLSSLASVNRQFRVIHLFSVEWPQMFSQKKHWWVYLPLRPCYCRSDPTVPSDLTKESLIATNLQSQRMLWVFWGGVWGGIVPLAAPHMTTVIFISYFWAFDKKQAFKSYLSSATAWFIFLFHDVI